VTVPEYRARNGTQRSKALNDQEMTWTALAPTWAFKRERVTRIELALSAWETPSDYLITALTWRFWWSPVTVVTPSSPRLMAR